MRVPVILLINKIDQIPKEKILKCIAEFSERYHFDAVIPMVTGSAYLTGFGTYLIDGTDPLKYGFEVG